MTAYNNLKFEYVGPTRDSKDLFNKIKNKQNEII